LYREVRPADAAERRIARSVTSFGTRKPFRTQDGFSQGKLADIR
jgi:hypothetical protein